MARTKSSRNGQLLVGIAPSAAPLVFCLLGVFITWMSTQSSSSALLVDFCCCVAKAVAESIGFASFSSVLPASATHSDVLECIQRHNKDPRCVSDCQWCTICAALRVRCIPLYSINGRYSLSTPETGAHRVFGFGAAWSSPRFGSRGIV